LTVDKKMRLLFVFLSLVLLLNISNVWKGRLQFCVVKVVKFLERMRNVCPE
jgi:hypothetical protein